MRQCNNTHFENFHSADTVFQHLGEKNTSSFNYHKLTESWGSGNYRVHGSFYTDLRAYTLDFGCKQ